MVIHRGGHFNKNLISLNYYHLSLIPRESINSIQDLIFLLEFKLNQQESEILKMPYWIAKKRLKQFEMYQKEFNKSINEALKGISKGVGKIPHIPSL